MPLDLEAVGDGGFQILTTSGHVGTETTRKGFGGFLKYEGYVKACNEATNTRLSALHKSLAEDLKTQRGLVLPASGIFYFKSPILGRNGDFICGLSYNETPSKEFFDKSPTVNNEAEARAEFQLQDGKELPEAVPGLVLKLAEA
jgi:hypothetical protein